MEKILYFTDNIQTRLVQNLAQIVNANLLHGQHKHGMYIIRHNPVLESLLRDCLHRNKEAHMS